LKRSDVDTQTEVSINTEPAKCNCRSKDADKGKIDFVDIASPSYNPADNNNISYQQVRGSTT
jgi:hypothetical protein